jgi:tRNA(Ile)-lysidine synthase
VAAAHKAAPLTDKEAHSLFDGLREHGHVALAVSGGSDSMALLWLAARWSRNDPGTKLSVLTVDHGLRPEAAAEADEVVRQASAFGLGAHILRWSGAKPKTGLQEQARAARYRLMGEWCRTNGATLLITAHTLDDQAETFLMRLARGSGSEGLAAMAPLSPGDPPIARPFLAVSRERLRATLLAAGRTWIDDPSNADERFERIRLRNLMPALAPHGVTAKAIGRSAQRLARANTALDHFAAASLDRIVAMKPEGFALIDRAGLAALPEEIALRVLSRLLRRLGGRSTPPRLLAVEGLFAWLAGVEGPARTLAGCRVVKRKRDIIIGREPGRLGREPALLGMGRACLWDNRFAIAVGGTDRPCAVMPAGVFATVPRSKDLPAFVQATLPAILVDGELAAIPAIGFRAASAPPGFSAVAAFGALI